MCGRSLLFFRLVPSAFFSRIFFAGFVSALQPLLDAALLRSGHSARRARLTSSLYWAILSEAYRSAHLTRLTPVGGW